LGSFLLHQDAHSFYQLIRQMYDGDGYVLIDAAKTTTTSNSTVPLRGIKQVNILSPLLFSLFMNDVVDVDWLCGCCYRH